MTAKKLLTLFILAAVSRLLAADQPLQDFERFHPETYHRPFGPNAPWNVPFRRLPPVPKNPC